MVVSGLGNLDYGIDPLLEPLIAPNGFPISEIL